jgi:phosphatidylglycerophosphatase A
VWICDKTGKALGMADYQGIVWDEIVSFMLVLFIAPPGWHWSLLAFVLFRLFDIFKPPPIRYFDNMWHEGFGVMFDDLLAAGYTLLCLALVKSILI